MTRLHSRGMIRPGSGDPRAPSPWRHRRPAATEFVTLAFGPEDKARLHLELFLPAGRGPFPVLLTQDHHRRWALAAVSRGYAACVYAGADSRDDTADWVPLWPGYDWTKLMRRAWAASRYVDYLRTRSEVDPGRIALTGHSRNGTTSLMAAAFDPRIAAVISSSSGAGGACPYRCFSELQFGEGIELITRRFPDWLHPRLRFFVGRESKLPIDQHQLLACIAPRPVLVATALNDNVESVWAVEQARAVALPVYPTWTDWKNASRERIDPRRFPAVRTPPGPAEPLAEEVDRAKKREGQERWRDQALWLLGDPPPRARVEAGSYGADPAAVAHLLNLGTVPAELAKESLNFGNAIAGDLYYPAQIYLLGYGTGAWAAWFAAALDPAVAGVILVNGIAPFRTDTTISGTGGIARWSTWLPLLPRLGAFLAHEDRIPCDVPELLTLVAPRPALVITPGIDQPAGFPALRQAIATARESYRRLGVAERLVFQRSDDYNHFAPELIWCLCGVETIQ